LLQTTQKAIIVEILLVPIPSDGNLTKKMIGFYQNMVAQTTPYWALLFLGTFSGQNYFWQTKILQRSQLLSFLILLIFILNSIIYDLNQKNSNIKIDST